MFLPGMWEYSIVYIDKTAELLLFLTIYHNFTESNQDRNLN